MLNLKAGYMLVELQTLEIEHLRLALTNPLVCKIMTDYFDITLGEMKS